MKLLAFDYDGNYMHDGLLKNSISEVVATGIYSDYYLSTDGNDNNSGLSPELAWKTIAKVNAATLTPGSNVHFKRGNVWREKLRINQSGTALLPITYTAYGSGAKPIINGADLITGWHDSYNNIDANIWGTIDPSEYPGVANVIIDNVLYKQVATLEELASPNTYWVKTASTPDSIYVYSTTNPNLRKAEVSRRNECIYGYNKNYINISYLEVRNGAVGLYLGGTLHDGRCNIDSVYAYRNRLAGIEFIGTDFSYNTVRNCVATYNGNGIVGWEGVNNTTFSHCYTAHGVHNYIEAGSKSARADGSGLQFYISDNVVIEYCESDNDATGIYLDPAGSAKTMTARYNYVHGSPIEASGIGYAGIGINHFTGGACYIYYNLLVNAGGNEVSAIHSESAQAGMIYIFNNTIVNDESKNIHTQIRLFYGANFVIKNNITYFKCPATDVDKLTRCNLTINDGGKFTSDFNQWSNQNGGNFLRINGTYYSSLASWKAVRSQDLNSAVTDPLFKNVASDWTLQAGSPCINAGVDVGLTQDILGNPIVGLPDIGAFETQLNPNIPLPVYLSSTVENATPARLEMSYNLSLANIVPAVSAFSVRVNSVTRTVNAVSVSGTKVLLTLASPIVYGAVVTVSYTKPSANPLQTAAGGQAVTVNAQAVTNKVSPVNPVYVSSAVENATPARLEMSYNLSLADIVPAVSAFSVKVNSATRTVNAVAVSGTKVLLTLASPVVYGDVVTVSYAKPSTNPLQTSSGGQVATTSAQIVTNHIINAPPIVTITSPVNNNAFTASANITITVNASDADGSITLVEFYNGSTRLGSKSAAPYTFTWNSVGAGTYSLIVIASDNLNAKTTSSAISITVNDDTPVVNQPPDISISNPIKGNKYEFPATIEINALASDPDGTISKVELYSGSDKLVQLTDSPYSFKWKDVGKGTYIITAIATDNLNATTTSSQIEFSVGDIHIYDANSEILNLYPNPNDGHFSIEVVNPLQNEKYEIIIMDLAGKQVYHGSILKEETIKHFDLSYIKSGYYIMMMMDKVILVTKKFIKK